MTKSTAPILILNAGSSSLKFAVFISGETGVGPVEVLGGQISAIGSDSSFFYRLAGGENKPVPLASGPPVTTHKQALEIILDFLEAWQISLSDIAGAGHRIVHGGTKFTAPVQVDGQVLGALEELAPLAPHHMPHNLEAIGSLAKLAPDLPQIACFDTAFHAAQAKTETRFSLPEIWFERGVRRYGFHGLNYAHVVRALPDVSRAPLPARLIILHLGNGASICAVKNGKSVATTMGFSTLDGLIMGTRSGAIDPGVLLYLQRTGGLDVNQLEDLLYNRSGLLGLSGISGNMQTLLADGSPVARFAIDAYCRAAARHAGSLLPLLGGLDAIVFTGGIGENAAAIRAKIAEYLSCFDVHLEDGANADNRNLISAPGSSAAVWVIPANEEKTMARQVFALIGPS